jgi:chemotaxis protein MotC
MRLTRWWKIKQIALLGGLVLAGTAVARAQDDPEIFKLVRSLQYVQDSIVLGDHAAGDMQRFLLGVIDQRLRAAPPQVFEDGRNIDAALVYAMSGGNPATMDLLVSHDVNGYFDSRLTGVLRRYLRGQGAESTGAIDALLNEYRNSQLGAYLYLVAGNASIGTDSNRALGYFDQVRLASPGTNLEEAALRRSLAIELQDHLVDRGMATANRYVRRFLYSPYAGQFVDMFVQLAVDQHEHVTFEAMSEIVNMMDADRAKELYLRVARQASLAGADDLARRAARAASGEGNAGPASDQDLGKLYGGIASVSGSNVLQAAQAIAAIPDDKLSPRDRALRDAARSVAEQILQPAPPPPARPAAPIASAAQAPTGQAAGQPASDDPFATPASGPAAQAPQQASTQAQAQTAQNQNDGASANGAPADAAATTADAGIKSFLAENQSRLKEIDAMLGQGSTRK